MFFQIESDVYVEVPIRLAGGIIGRTKCNACARRPARLFSGCTLLIFFYTFVHVPYLGEHP
jgi:hypothetical protein